MRTLSSIFLMVAVFASSALAQPAVEVRPDAAISELLSYSVPAEDWQEHLKKRRKAGWVPPPLPSAESPDTADIARLAGHWRTDRPDERVSGHPSAAVRERLLAYCEERPAMFDMLMGRFSRSQEGVLARIQKLHDRLAAAAGRDEEAQAALPKVRLWLMTEAGLFREELKAAAERYFTRPEDSDLQAAFETLQKLEPKAATALLLRMVEEESPAERVTALLRLHAMKNAPTGAWQEELKKIITTREIPALVRARALKGIGEADWSGKMEWVMSLFDDPGLGLVQMDKYDQEEPLALLVKQAPDFWVPKIIGLVGNSNRAVHDNAVRCLAQFHLGLKREDALRPLLPWLANPQWALDADGYGRLRLLQTLDSVNLPESVPGLLWALEHDSGHQLSAAASAVAHYQATEAVPALRQALHRESDSYHRRYVVGALLKLKGLSLAEQAQAVEQYEDQMLTKEGRQALQDDQLWVVMPSGKKTPGVDPARQVMVATGMELCQEEASQSGLLVEALMKRVEKLRLRNPELAEALEQRISLWRTAPSARLLEARLRAGRFSGRWLWQLFSTDDSPALELKALRDLPPATEAVLALLLKDESRMSQILQGGAAEGQAMLLACARLRRTPLPLDMVGRLLDSKHVLRARGAELYLEAEDSAQARALLLRRFKGEARILGARMGHDPGHFSYGGLSEVQDLLRKQVLATKGPLEIHALLSAGYWGDVGQVWVEVEGEKATLVNDQGSGRYRTRALTPAELAELVAYVSQHRVDDLPPLTLPVDDGIQYEYVHLTAEGGRRVFMNNPGTYSGGLAGHGSRFVPAQEGDNEVNDSVYVGLVRLFQKLMEDESGLKVTYRTETPILGLKIVIPQEQKSIGAVMEQNGVLMVNASRPGGARATWMPAVTENELTKRAKTLNGPALALPNAGFPEGFYVPEHLVNASWLTATSGGHVRPARREKDDGEGLWLCREKQEPELIVKGTFASPITSLDGRWVVAARVLGRSWAEPNDVVRINMTTHEVFPLKLAPADEFSTVTRLPHSGKILISRARNPVAPGIEPKEGPEKTEYHLLDPATGDLERVRGEFGPLDDETWRPLQPTSEPGVVWASVSKFDSGRIQQVALGRYDLRTFSFTKVMDVPRWNVSSMDFWVDDKTRTVFLAMGDLLSFPLPEKNDAGKAPVKQ